jgi:hypothetical protein
MSSLLAHSHKILRANVVFAFRACLFLLPPPYEGQQGLQVIICEGPRAQEGGAHNLHAAPVHFRALRACLLQRQVALLAKILVVILTHLLVFLHERGGGGAGFT